MDSTDTITFSKRRVDQFLGTVLLAPLGLFCLLGSPIAFVKLIQEGHHPVALVASAIFAFAPLMSFGFGMLLITVFDGRKVTVSREEIRVHRLIGRTRTDDIRSLKNIVLHGNPTQLVFLPSVGAALDPVPGGLSEGNACRDRRAPTDEGRTFG